MLRLRAVTRILKAPRFTLTTQVVAFVASTALHFLPSDVLQQVRFVSVLSIVALQLASLAGIAAALVAVSQASGYTLNQADKEWLTQMVERALTDADPARSPRPAVQPNHPAP